MVSREQIFISLSVVRSQQGMHVVVVEALLVAVFLSRKRADTYRHKETLSPPPYLFATYLAGPA